MENTSNNENFWNDLLHQSYPVSIIDRFLDSINIKKLLKIILHKPPFKVTNSFISGFILLIFLIWLYYLSDNTSKSIIIGVLIIFLILDFLGKNVDFIRTFLFSEDSNKAFINNISKYSSDEAEKQTRIRRFTSSNINHYLDKVKKNPNSEYGFVLENILIYNSLSIENFDIIFSEEFLKLNLLRKNLIIKLLMSYKDKLSKKDLLNLYNYFKIDDKILRYIFATQTQSEFLIKDNLELNVYAEKFQINSDSNFKTLKLNLPNLEIDRRKLLESSVNNGAVITFFLTLAFTGILNFFMDILLTNGNLNPKHSINFLLVFVFSLIISVVIVSINWKIFSQIQIKNWNNFKAFVESV